MGSDVIRGELGAHSTTAHNSLSQCPVNNETSPPPHIQPQSPGVRLDLQQGTPANN